MSARQWLLSAAMMAGVLALVAGSLTLAGRTVTPPAQAAPNGVTFPPVDRLEHYATVERGATREHMLTSRAALEAVKAQRPVPTGTQVVLVDYLNGEIQRYLVGQKVGDGQNDWQYQWFRPDQSVKADENVARCYSCHLSRADRQFLFTYTDALRFK